MALRIKKLSTKCVCISVPMGRSLQNCSFFQENLKIFYKYIIDVTIQVLKIKLSCYLQTSDEHAVRSTEGVVVQWYNPLTLQSEQSEGVGLIPGRVPLLQYHDKGSRT